MSMLPDDEEKVRRVQKLKENLREKHALEIESRLSKEAAAEEDEEDPILTRFSKYRRSGSQKHVSNLIRRVEGSISKDDYKDQKFQSSQFTPERESIKFHPVAAPASSSHKYSDACTKKEPISQSHHNQNNTVYFFETDSKNRNEASSSSSYLKKSKVSIAKTTGTGTAIPATSSSFNYFPKESSSSTNKEDAYLDEPDEDSATALCPSNRKVLKKPLIPLILRSPENKFAVPDTEEFILNKTKYHKKPSILKKKSEFAAGTGPSTTSSSSGSVSFDLEQDNLSDGPGGNEAQAGSGSSSGLIRTKSSDSCDSETGYWSGADSTTGGHGILKNSNREDQDFKSILKHRRSSLGNSIGNLSSSTNSSSSDNQEPLHSILKRKLSYDSSVILNHQSSSTNSKSNSLCLSTHSLPGSLAHSLSPEPKPILKKKSPTISTEELADSYAYADEYETIDLNNPKPILKKRTTKTTGDAQNYVYLSDGGGGGNNSGDEGIVITCGPGQPGTSNIKPKPILKKKVEGFEATDSDHQYQSQRTKSPSILKQHRTKEFQDSDDEDDVENGALLLAHGTSRSRRYYSSCSEVNDISSSSFSSHFDSTTRRVSEPSPKSPRFYQGEEEDGEGESFSSNLSPSPRFFKSKSPIEDIDYYSLYKMNDRTESEEDIINTRSVAERRSLFIQMEREKLGLSIESSATKKKSPASLRFRTQPVTSHEIELALKKVPSDKLKSEILTTGTDDGKKELLGELLGELSERNEHKHTSTHPTNPNSEKLIESAISGIIKRKLNQQQKQEEDKNLVSKNCKNKEIIAHKPPRPTQRTATAAILIPKPKESVPQPLPILLKETEEPSKLSLRDRVSLFNHFAEKSTGTAADAYRLSTRRAVTSKRFSTQPITTSDFQLRNLLFQTTTTYATAKPSSLNRSSTQSKAAIETETEKQKELDCEVSTSPSVHLQALNLAEEKETGSISKVSNKSTRPAKMRSKVRLSSKPVAGTSSSNDDELSSDSDSPASASSSSGENSDPILEKWKGTVDSEFGFVKKHLSKSSSCNFGKSSSTTSSTVIENTSPGLTTMEEPLSVLHPNKIPRNSIAEKIAALKSNGETNWKKKVQKDLTIGPKILPNLLIGSPTSGGSGGSGSSGEEIEDQNDHHQLQNRNNKELSSSASVVASRKTLLEKSQDGWRSRVGRNDAKDLTVNEKLVKAGKLPPTGITTTASTGITKPSLIESGKLKGIKAVLPPIKFRPKNELTGAPVIGNNRHTVCIPSALEKEEKLNQENNSQSQQNLYKRSTSLTPKQNRSESSNSSCSSDEDSTKVTRSIVPNDNETFTSFFAPTTNSSSAKASAPVPIDDSSFNSISATATSRQFLGLRKNIHRAPRTHQPGGGKNPIKSLASRGLGQGEQSYTEIKPEILEKEIKKRSQIETLAKTSHLSVEALAGLISKEDFTKISLKKANSSLTTRPREFPYPMLIRVKGKRWVQIRLVSPRIESLSSGDCYLLLTGEKVYQYIGEFSNRMEKSKLSDILHHIVQKKDLGTRLTSLSQVITIEEPISNKEDNRYYSEFIGILGSTAQEPKSPSHSVEEEELLGDEVDEAYEIGVIRTNRAFEVDPVKEELLPLLEEGSGWGSQPKYSTLREDRVLVFDFGSEMYFWSGSRADPATKKLGYKLASEMFTQEAYNFSQVEHEWSPLGFLVVGDKRPDWCWLKKINQHMEPILFIEKFYDWPDYSGKLIREMDIKGQKGNSRGGSDGMIKVGGFNFQPCSVPDLLSTWSQVPEPSLELEGFDIGRGDEIHDNTEFRHYTINSLGLKAWKISEFSKTELEPGNLGHFWSHETYVLRWQYSVTQISRDLKGNKSKHGAGLMGRDRTVYFFWHGKDSKLTEQGASALMTVELDQEKGPQVRVVQGHEPPAFLRLFQGGMFVHSEEHSQSQSDLKLYVALGCVQEEGHLVQVPMEPSSFRSRGSFLLLDSTSRNICVWNGSSSPDISRKISQLAGIKLASTISKPSPYTLSELAEGDEPSQFFSRLNLSLSNEMKWRESYSSLKGMRIIPESQQYNYSIFRFTTLNGHLEGLPVPCPHRKAGTYNPFPILQETLYESQQPSIFLIHTGEMTWLWMGWSPRGDEENENTVTGSGDYRWNSERKAAIETALQFLNTFKNGSHYGYIVHAGLEPQLFQSLFPTWTIHQEPRMINLEDGKILNSLTPLAEAYEKFTGKSIYSFQELQEKPEGVDLLKLETYLSDDEFESLLKMTRTEFNKLQQWRKTELKKQAGLF